MGRPKRLEPRRGRWREQVHIEILQGPKADRGDESWDANEAFVDEITHDAEQLHRRSNPVQSA